MEVDEEYKAHVSSFRKLLETKPLEGLEEGDDASSFLSDRDCMRFIRARKMDVRKAADMADKWWVWYNTPVEGSNGIAVAPRHILDNPEDPNEEIYTRLMPHSNMGEDKEGRCVYWEMSGEISSRFSEVIKELTVQDLVIRHIRQQEYMVKRLAIASEKHKKPIEKQVVVFNLANLSYSVHLEAMSAFKQTIKIDEAYYPERLQYFFMINAPWFFTAIWAMLKPFIDPVTSDKIIMLGSDYLDKLREYIDDSQIPVELGGSFKMIWRWPYSIPENCDESPGNPDV